MSSFKEILIVAHILENNNNKFYSHRKFFMDDRHLPIVIPQLMSCLNICK